MAEMVCLNCKFCKRCKKMTDYEWEWFYICTLFANEKDGWCMALGENPNRENLDLCEAWEEQK